MVIGETSWGALLNAEKTLDTNRVEGKLEVRIVVLFLLVVFY